MSNTTENQFAFRCSLALLRDDPEAMAFAIEEASESHSAGELLNALAVPLTALIVEKFGGGTEAEKQLQEALTILAGREE